MRGYTLLELLTALSVAAILAVLYSSITSEFLPKQRLIAKRNELVGFFQLARAEAITRGGVLICSKTSRCNGFDGGDLVAFHDDNQNKVRDGNEVILASVASTRKMPIFRNGWGKQDFLTYDSMGRLHYQNGHFLICNSGLGLTLVMNWRGRVRQGTGPSVNDQCD